MKTLFKLLGNVNELYWKCRTGLLGFKVYWRKF